LKILIADDDPISRRLLEATLARLGHEVLAVPDGLEALSSLLAADGPRMAILDWMMPGLDGLAVCRAVRHRTSPYAWLILLTSRDRHEDMLAGLEAGADDFLTKPLSVVELQARLRSGARVLDSQESLLAAQEALRLEAIRDHLTGLWNRRMILDQLGRELHRAAHEKRSLAVVLVDLDHFKAVNDTHGHAAGDTVLREAAARMRVALRDYDFIGRYGGEEFLILLPGCDGESARLVAERVRMRVASSPIGFGASNVSITVSLGVAWTGTSREAAASLIDAADAALYRAKALGRDRVEILDGEHA
jgi:two-component system, cell cycle response regulator